MSIDRPQDSSLGAKRRTGAERRTRRLSKCLSFYKKEFIGNTTYLKEEGDALYAWDHAPSPESPSWTRTDHLQFRTSRMPLFFEGAEEEFLKLAKGAAH